MGRFPLFLAAALLAVAVPAGAVADQHWVVYIRADPSVSFAGTLVAVRSDGRGERTILEDVLHADLGSDGVVYAVTEMAPSDAEEVPSSLVRLDVREADPTPVFPGEVGTLYQSPTVSAGGDVAFLRYVSRTVKPPDFLQEGVPTLARAGIPVLVPPEEPPLTGHLVAEADDESYRALFTNDPQGQRSHAEQVNRFVSGRLGEEEAPPEATAVPVREQDGSFSCGASACFLTWEEFGITYSVGEFGSTDEAVEFAESLLTMDELSGPGWRDGQASTFQVPQLVVQDREGDERRLESVRSFCECGYRPVDWSPEGDRVLVVFGAELFTSLREYRADGKGSPEILQEPEDRVIIDAAYGPEGILVLTGGEGGPPGALSTLAGEPVLEDVTALDVQGSTMAYVRGGGEVAIRDLRTGSERAIGQGAVDVSLAPDLIAAARPPTIPSTEEGFPALLAFLVAAAAASLLGGAALVWMGIRRRQR